MFVPRVGRAGPEIRFYVFASTDIRPHALEQELAAALPGIQVRVFGRARELQSAVETDAPEVVLARPVVLEYLNRAPALKGARHGSTGEPYVLLGVGREVKPPDLTDQAIGTVDLIGRHEMKAFVSRVLGVPAPKIKPVTTEHDLLPLLQFGEVAAVLTPERWVSILKSKSNLDLRMTLLPNTVGLPALWFVSDSVRAAVQPRVKAWSPALNGRFGVDEWQ
jgi:hypothetical protein